MFVCFGWLRVWCFGLVLLCGLFGFGLVGVGGEMKRLLVVTVTKGFRHSSIGVGEGVLGSFGRRHGWLEVEFARTDEELVERMSLAGLGRYDGVVFANTSGELPLPDRDGFLEWVRGGGGFVGVHAASDTLHGYRPYIEMLGGEFETHGPQVGVDLVVEDEGHVACAHFGPGFGVFDEIYIVKSFRRDRVHGLLSLHHHPNSRVPGDFPVAWCRFFGEGRVFYTSLGHREDVWTDGGFQRHVWGGVLWVLGLGEGDGSPVDLGYVVGEEEGEEGFVGLFDGVSLDGWVLRDGDGKGGWGASNGMLLNVVGEGDGGRDLVSEEAYWNFTVRYEYQVPPGGNSGFYLRGRHEVQILEDAGGRELRDGGNGAIYSLKAPDVFVSRGAGVWQEVEATIVDDRVWVFLNGVLVHDGVEVREATGGELDGRVGEPGPIMLQGDHGSVGFRNMRIKVLE